ncbi:MAG: hypothetical protein U1F30_14255 [Steroidobacteraceae bacterium]
MRAVRRTSRSSVRAAACASRRRCSGPRLTLWDEAGVATTRDYPIRGSGYGYQLLAVRDALRSGATQCEAMGWADTLAVMRCLDAVRRQLGVAFPGELKRMGKQVCL